jgi:hypothetical protein
LPERFSAIASRGLPRFSCDDANPPVADDIDGDPRGRDYGNASAQVFDIGADEVWFGIFADRFEQ